MSEINSLVLIADPKVLAIPIEENDEPLIDIRNYSDLLYGPSPEIEDNQHYTFMRESVFAKLLAAQQLLPSRLRFCLYEGLRTIAVQEYIYTQRWNAVRKLLPQASEQEIYLEAIKIISPVKMPDGSINIPPHSTGAAVDVYLVDAATHAPVEMGLLVVDWLADPEGTLSQADSSHISIEAKENRQLMAEVLRAQEFVNYPTEYWHWSYGDRYWAYMQNAPSAFFGLAKGF